jgi:hypothetical protein
MTAPAKRPGRFLRSDIKRANLFCEALLPHKSISACPDAVYFDAPEIFAASSALIPYLTALPTVDFTFSRMPSIDGLKCQKLGQISLLI